MQQIEKWSVKAVFFLPHAVTFSPYAYIFSREAVTFSREAVALLSLKGNEGMSNDIPSLSGSSSPSGGLGGYLITARFTACL